MTIGTSPSHDDDSSNSPLADRLARWRADTPGCASRVHLNNAGAALMPRPVRMAIDKHLDREMQCGGYEAADEAADAVAAGYADIARLVQAQPRNIAIMQNSTMAFAQALNAFDLGPGDRILTTQADYASNQIMFLSLAQRRHIEVVRAANLPEGGVDPDSMRSLIRRQRPALVTVTWVPTQSGLVQDVEAVGAVCDEVGVPYLVDACQAVGQIPIDVSRLRCDYLSATGRKFLRGPRGIGFLYVSDRALASGAHPLLVDLYGATWTETDAFELTADARRFETWEFPYALVLGLGAAASYMLEVGVEVAKDRARHLASRARKQLAALPGVRVLDEGRELCAIVSAQLGDRDVEAVVLELRRRGINTTTIIRPHAVIDMDKKRVDSALRISPHYYNTEEEIDRAIEEIQLILGSR